MQLNNMKNVKSLLKSATTCLLGVTAATGAQAQISDDLEIDVAVLAYSETDRVRALEPAIAVKKTFDDESVLGFKLVLDTLTGASHNGAAASEQAQTFTRPSGKGSYTSGAQETPLDDTFRDTRINLSGSYEHGISRFEKLAWGANVSNEYDFVSVGGSGTYFRDINQRNTTLSAGFSFEIDSIRAVGGFAEPLSEMKASSLGQDKEGGSHTREMMELLLGVTQIIDRNTLVQFNYGFALSDGEHNDPYKIVSVLDSVGDLIPANGLSGTYLYERRPDSRNKQSLFAKVKRFVSGDVADVSYRFMWDDWGIESSTIDMHYRFNISPSWYLEPHVRYYDQKEADFYRHSITSAQTVPDFLSADYRLGSMQATTVGLKVGFLTPDGNKSSVRVEYYQQQGDSNPSDALVNQQNVDLYPTVNAVILQYNYHF